MNRKQIEFKNSNHVLSALVGDVNASYEDFLIFVLIQRSLELIEVYKYLAGSVKDVETKAFFEHMARLKYEDMKHFQEVYCKDNTKALEKEKQKRLSSILNGKSDSPEIKNINEACKYVLNVEVKNFELYSRLSQLETDPSIKKLFIAAHHMHKSNLNHVEKLMKSFSNAT